MRILAIVQSKGGTGKTTIALNLLAAAAEAGKQTVFIDLDPSTTGSTLLVGYVPPEESLYAVLHDNRSPNQIKRYVPELNCIILPGSFRLSTLPADLPTNKLAHVLRNIEQDRVDIEGEAFVPDLAILDCPGGDVNLARMALHAADGVAVPMNFSAIDLTANESTVQLIATIRAARGGQPSFAGIIPNRIPRGDTVARDLAFLVASRLPLLPTIPESNLIRRTGSAAEIEGRVVVKSHPQSKAANQFRALYTVLTGEQSWTREDGIESLAEQLRVSSDSISLDQDQADAALALDGATA